MAVINFREFRPTDDQIASVRRATRVTLPAAAWRKVLHFGGNALTECGPITLSERIDFALRDYPDSDDPVTVGILYTQERQAVEAALARADE